jgi:hypothetical protein
MQMTFSPAFARCRAAAFPAKPPPMTVTSQAVAGRWSGAGSVCEGKVVIAQLRWPNWAGTVPSSSERIYSRKPLGGRTEIFTLIIFNNLQKRNRRFKEHLRPIRGVYRF